MKHRTFLISCVYHHYHIDCDLPSIYFDIFFYFLSSVFFWFIGSIFLFWMLILYCIQTKISSTSSQVVFKLCLWSILPCGVKFIYLFLSGWCFLIFLRNFFLMPSLHSFNIFCFLNRSFLVVLEFNFSHFFWNLCVQ